MMPDLSRRGLKGDLCGRSPKTDAEFLIAHQQDDCGIEVVRAVLSRL